MVPPEEKPSRFENRQYIKKIDKVLSNVMAQRKDAFTTVGKIEEQVEKIWPLLNEWPTLDSGEFVVETTHIEIVKPNPLEYPPTGDTGKSLYEQALLVEARTKDDNNFLKIILNKVKKFNSYVRKFYKQTGLPTSQKETTEQLLIDLLGKTRSITDDHHDYVEQIEKYATACKDIS